MIQYGLWLLGLIGCYMILRRMFEIEVTQQKMLSNHKDLKEWLEKVRKDNEDLLAVLQSISQVQSLIVAQFKPKPEQAQRVIKGIVKKNGNIYRRTEEQKRRASEIQKQRMANKKAFGSFKIPEPEVKEGSIPSRAPLIQEPEDV